MIFHAALQQQLSVQLGVDIYDADISTNTLFARVDTITRPELTSKEKVDIAKELIESQGMFGIKIKYKTVTSKMTTPQRK